MANDPPAQPYDPADLPELHQYVILLNVFGTGLLEAAFRRWEKYRDTQLAQGRKWNGFLWFLETCLVRGLREMDTVLDPLEAELAKDAKLKL